MDTNNSYSISEIARLYGVTTRTIRYYEEIGLLNPSRSPGGQRIFKKQEQARLTLIFRGKKYGFRLDEIREMIQLFDRDRTGQKQLKRTIEYGKEKIKEVTERIDELKQIKAEMNELLVEFQQKLCELEREENEHT